VFFFTAKTLGFAQGSQRLIKALKIVANFAIFFANLVVVFFKN